MEPLPAAAVADACVRLDVPARAVPLRPTLPGKLLVGPALPVRHAGSVDVFFEAVQAAPTGAILCIDNEGRMDEGCIGDLTALEARHHGVAAIVVDGCHRDTAALCGMGFPVWSRGAYPFGPRAARPRKADALQRAQVAGCDVVPGDVVALDDDGAVFVPGRVAPRVWALARQIANTEGDQARRAAGGEPLCVQFQVPVFLAARRRDASVTFRQHLRQIGKAIEE